MNFLAHIYLSGDNELITIGNFMADSIKGKRYQNYPNAIQIGILLHREIDTFTDAHPIVRQSTKRLHKNYGHYSGIIVDVLYDHFLAKNWSDYSTVPLKNYVADFYKLLQSHYEILPPNIHHMMPYMMAENWLLNYAKIEGIQHILSAMNRRTNFSGIDKATHELKTFYTEFEDEFTRFFEELRSFSTEKIATLTAIYTLE